MPEQITVVASSGSGRGPTREPDDPFRTGREPLRGSRASEESWSVARALSTLVGSRVPVVDRYLDALSHAPAEHLRLLQQRGAAICFAPTIEHALTSDWANERRGRPLTSRQVWTVHLHYSQETGTAAIYDPGIDALVLPTSYVTRDLERVVLHEPGHALTMSHVSVRESLITNLPPEIARRLRDSGFSQESGGLEDAVKEAVADAYVFLIVGRHEELPEPLLSELILILTTISEGSEMRLDFDTDGFLW